METTTKNQQVKQERIVFIEYAFAKPGQHFIAVKHGRNIIGRIFREYDEAAQKENYYAKDYNRNPIFEGENNINSIKNFFIADAERLSDEMIFSRAPFPVELDKEVKSPEQPKREEQLLQLRSGKESPNKSNELSK